MFSRDFFAFCTSLKPIELKALGALSDGRQMATGEVVYRAGDIANELYIINRGSVELTLGDADSPEPPIQLARGDIFGDLELLGGTLRRHTVRVTEEVSLRTIHRDAFAEMLARVPSFFRFLCNHLAHRLMDPRVSSSPVVRALELSGNLANFDLVTIYQTIMHSAQSGDLCILRENRELLATFSFEEGRPRGGQFEHLRGAEAFWQLFQAAALRGAFSFTSGKTPTIHVLESAWVDRSADELLISALQARDEVDSLRAAMPDGSARLEPCRPHLDAAVVQRNGTGALLGQIWERSARRRTLLGDLYPQFQVSELKIYRAVDELVRTGHIALTPTVNSQKVA